MQNFKKLLKDKTIKHYYFMSKDIDYFATHDLKHALRVVQTCKKLATKLNLNANDIENICIAALLHDTGASNYGKKITQKEVIISQKIILITKKFWMPSFSIVKDTIAIMAIF